VGAASVIGDTISLQVRPESDVTATVRPTATGTQTQQNSDFASFGVVAVAKTGYALQTRVGSGLTGSYAVDAKGSEAQAPGRHSICRCAAERRIRTAPPLTAELGQLRTERNCAGSELERDVQR
jgi:hypothetical protein